MKLCLVLSFLLATGLARRWSGPPRIFFSRRGPPRIFFSRRGPPQISFSRRGPPQPGSSGPGPSRPDPPRPGPPSRPDPPRPGPPSRRSAAAGSQNSKYVYDENCKLGRWIKVTSEDCPVAFEDPRFVYYESFCGSEMADQHKEWYEDEVQGVWTYPEYGYCETLPTYLACPALEKCDDVPPPPPSN